MSDKEIIEALRAVLESKDQEIKRLGDLIKLAFEEGRNSNDKDVSNYWAWERFLTEFVR